MNEWIDGNQRYLSLAILQIRAQLEQYKANADNNIEKSEAINTRLAELQTQMQEIISGLSAPPALENLVQIFGFSSFERNLLLACAAVELESSFAGLIAELQGNTNTLLPTFSFMLATMQNAHWSAISPGAPLRYWRMIELNTEPLISKAPIKIDEHILHYLTGVNYLDERLTGLIEPSYAKADIVPSHSTLALQIINFLIEKFKKTGFNPVQLTGNNNSDKENIAVYICRQLQLTPFIISANAIPSSQKEIIELTRLWNREAALKSYALIVDNSNVDVSDKQRTHGINNFISNIQSLLIINTGQANSVNNKYAQFEVVKPTQQEQVNLWKTNLNDKSALEDNELNILVSQFNLSAKTIKTAGEELAQAAVAYVNGNYNKQALNNAWKTCCLHSRLDIGELTQRIEPIAQMDDLVLPIAQKEILKELIIHAKYRVKVYNDWGFAKRSNRGLGITALFAGESGTGKTMASEVLANELKLDLYRIDLSQVVNKYIGETEKNLKKIFDAAEDGGAILLFDEADALFGKRSEVKDSHDRYANVEISYLLQRMEAYRGIAILTTNMKNAMDKAMLRRIRFVVQFPFPDAEQRAEIWKKIFPSATPVNNLDMLKLSRLNVAGGNIKNIALNAAFIAANENEAVGMQHVQRALRSEYDKIEKPLTNTEIGLLK